MARARFVARAQSRRRPPWYQRLPRPVQRAALRMWSAVPWRLRRPLVPLGALFGPHTVSATPSPGPDTVPGVAALRAEGFQPVEQHTGAVWLAGVWPHQHRRSVPETRPAWLDDDECDGRLWLVRSPWPAFTVEDVIRILWPWVERDRARDEAVFRSRAAEVLGWDEARALEWRDEVDRRRP